ncbi:MAG: hypothetical protein ABF285_01795 [Pacificibacter sp.]|uniref:hypothetical protein n=1 Tax=Pacificibacter sp. TaxID=1917866 RepID=UPI00321B1030
MAFKLYSDEYALRLSREIDVHLHDGMDVAGAVRKAGISDKNYDYWRKKCGGMARPQLSEMKVPKTENEILKRIVVDLQFDKVILKESFDYLKLLGVDVRDTPQDTDLFWIHQFN